MSSGSQKTTTQAASEPWKAAQPALQDSLKDAQNIYKSGTSFQPYTGSTVVPYSKQTEQGMWGIQNRADAWQPALDRNFEQIAGQAAKGGLNTAQQRALTGMQAFGDGAGNVSGTNMQGVYNKAGLPSASQQNLGGIAGGAGQSYAESRLGGLANGGGQSFANKNLMGLGQNGGGPSFAEQGLGGLAANGGGKSYSEQSLGGIGANGGGQSFSQQYLGDIASGGMLNRQDPNFERVLNRATENATTSGAMQASAGGRYGSGQASQAVARQVGDIEAEARLGQYNTERQNQVNATGMMDQQRQSGIQNQLAATGQMDQNRLAGINNKFTATGMMDQGRQTGINNQLAATSQQDAQRNQGIANQFTATGMMDQGRQAEIANQMAASGQIDTAKNASLAQQLSAASQLAQTQAQNADRRIGATGSAFNAGQQQQNNVIANTNALSNAYTAGQQPSQDRMNVGSMYEDLAGRTMNDQLRIWNEKQQAPLKGVEWLNAIGSGSGSLGGTSSQTAQQPKANPWGQALGGALGLNSLLGGF